MIKISVPNDDHVALRAMAKALEEIAVARGAPAQGKQIGELNYKINIDTTGATAALEKLVKQAESDTTSQQVESLATHIITSQEKDGDPVYMGNGNISQGYRIEVEELPTTDSTGTPWDDRIHSASKALNGDGTWRLRRKPADKTPEQWAEYVKWVEEDIHTAQHGQSEEEELQPPLYETAPGHIGVMQSEPAITPEGDDFHVDAGVVTEQQLASFPPPPPVPQLGGGSQSTPYKLVGAGDDLSSGAGVTPQTAGITAATGGGVPVTMTFPQVMAFLTERHGRITSAQVDQIIADMGLEKITDLNTQPEHTGPFIARVKALLRE